MAPFEWLAAGYFGACAAIGAWRQSIKGILCALAAALLVIVARFAAPWELRVLAPHLYLILGYWIPALLTSPATDGRFERWLARADERLGFRSRDPGFAAHVLEAAYLLCYPLVPFSFAIVFWLGDPSQVTQFWEAVLLSGYACYGTLPWTPARPPRLILPPEGGSHTISPNVASGFPPPRASARYGEARRSLGEGGSRKSILASINLFVLTQVSHQRNTFPSGHVSVAVAAALSVMQVSIGAGLVVLLVASGVAVAAAAGRYHYLVDVLLGLVVGVLAWAIALASW